MPRILLSNAIAAVSLMSFGASHAADLGARPNRPAPAVVTPSAPEYSWTGFYIGLQGGYGAGDSNGTQNEGGTFFPVVPYSIDPHGFLGGGHVGYNLQIGQFVYGIEGDIEAADVKGLSIVSTAGQDYFFNAKADMLASVRGRLGVTRNGWLAYATGGVAWGHISTPPLNALSGTRNGWTAGAGLEYAFSPNWSTRLEYRYTDLGRERAPGGESTSFDNNSFAFHAVRVGLSYRLGGLK
jgi:outer membrane immunogenic protein